MHTDGVSLAVLRLVRDFGALGHDLLGLLGCNTVSGWGGVMCRTDFLVLLAGFGELFRQAVHLVVALHALNELLTQVSDCVMCDVQM